MPIFTAHIGDITIAPTWYGLMYALSFLIAWWLIRKQFTSKQTDTILFASILGVIIGGRLGYVLFYDLPYYLSNFSEIFMPWRGGMSFHGGLIGVVIAWWITSKKIKISFLELVDKVVWIVPIGLFFGRVGNLINGELLGDSWYMGPFFPRVVDGIPYFPAPIIEAFLEGIVLFLILFWKRKHIRYPGQVGVWFIGFYGLLRFIAEFWRWPDDHIGYLLWNWVTLGHIFSVIMIFIFLTLSKVLKK